jgi:hypothetical protein
MAFEPPPDIMKAGERPARVRTGAKTATKTQERDMLDKLQALAEDPMVLVPEWLGPERSNPFKRLFWKLEKIHKRQDSGRRLRWSARGKQLWNGYAASLLILKGAKIPSFASFKLRNLDVKYVYRTGTHRNALIGVQHHDDPELRLLGYVPYAKKKGALLLSGDSSFVAVPRDTKAPTHVLRELLAAKGVKATVDDQGARCAHLDGPKWTYKYEVPDLQWTVRLCLDCVQKIGGSLADLLDLRILGPDEKPRVEPLLEGRPYTVRPESAQALYADFGAKAFEKALHHARDNYVSFSDIELAQWTRDELQKLLQERPEGFLLVGDDLWLTDFEAAADAYVETDIERRAIKTAFRRSSPRMRVGDTSLHKILEPYWKEHGHAILSELAGDLLRDEELAGLERLSPSEALTSLARILGARERFREFLQFDEVDPRLDFVLNCLQLQRAGETRILSEKLHSGARDPPMRSLTLAVARGLGEASGFEWQYAPHEKDAASFLEPYVREVLSASPATLAPSLTKLAQAIGAPAPRPKAAAT